MLEAKEQELELNEMEQVSGSGLIDWVVQNIAAPVKEFYDATELNTAQNCMLAEIKGRH